jgi:hypothetical protein
MINDALLGGREYDPVSLGKPPLADSGLSSDRRSKILDNRLVEREDFGITVDFAVTKVDTASSMINFFGVLLAEEDAISA